MSDRNSFVAKLRSRVNRGDSWLTYDLGRLFAADKLKADAVEELETRLLTADAGLEVTNSISERLTRELHAGRIRNEQQLRDTLRTALLEILKPVAQPLVIADFIRPYILFVAGVNGVGKTTTIGKLALRLKNQGLSVLLAAGDTFRAAAVEQLEAWARRAGVPCHSAQRGQSGGQSGGDPASVIFDAVQLAKAKKIDVVIADTAGRLHTQAHLMEELRKIKRVIQKHDPYAPHEVMLVVDATTGSNALNQAVQFHEAIGLTGITITKLDGTAKGGILLSIARRLSLPIRFVGVGEGLDDLEPFDAEAYADALIGT